MISGNRSTEERGESKVFFAGLLTVAPCSLQALHARAIGTAEHNQKPLCGAVGSTRRERHLKVRFPGQRISFVEGRTEHALEHKSLLQHDRLRQECLYF